MQQLVRQLVYTMFISNNGASFQLWWKENLVKHRKVSKYYETDCGFWWLMKSIETIKYVEVSAVVIPFVFIFYDLSNTPEEYSIFTVRISTISKTEKYIDKLYDETEKSQLKEEIQLELRHRFPTEWKENEHFEKFLQKPQLSNHYFLKWNQLSTSGTEGKRSCNKNSAQYERQAYWNLLFYVVYHSPRIKMLRP